MPPAAEPGADPGRGSSLRSRPRAGLRSLWEPWGPDGPGAGLRLTLVTGLLLLAAALRAGRALLRWEEVSIAYAAYQAPLIQAWGDPGLMLDSWVGLHPPL